MNKRMTLTKRGTLPLPEIQAFRLLKGINPKVLRQVKDIPQSGVLAAMGVPFRKDAYPYTMKLLA